MNRLVASMLLMGLGCAGAPAPVVAPAPAPDLPPAEPGVVAPETTPVQTTSLPLWFRPIVLLHRGDAEHGPYHLPDFMEPFVHRSSEAMRCAVEWVNEDPVPSGPLWIDFFITGSGRITPLALRGARPLAWPCLEHVVNHMDFNPPVGGGRATSLAVFFRPSSISWGRSPALRPMFLPRERGDAPREPDEISYDQDSADFLWSLGQLRSRLSPEARPATELERLLSRHRAAESEEGPEEAAITATGRLAEEGPDPVTRATARLLLARQHWLRGDRGASHRALLSLVCPHPRSGPDAPPERSEIYWNSWWVLHSNRDSLHPTPKAMRAWAKVRERELAKDKTPEHHPSSLDEETTFRNPFLGCVPAEGATPAMLAEAWAVLGDIHGMGWQFGGAFSSNRALVAYARSLTLASDDLVRLQLALLNQRSWRHRAASTLLSGLLLSNEQATGEGALIRELALPILALSMIEPDFEGQPESEPFLPGNTLLWELERQADRDLSITGAGGGIPQSKPQNVPLGAIALGHVRDTSLVPAGAWFAQPLIVAMAQALHRLNQLQDAAQLYEHALATFPLHPDAPSAAAALIRISRMQRRIARPGSPEQAEAARKQAAAEKHFEASYLSRSSPWALANGANPAALERATALARQLTEP